MKTKETKSRKVRVRFAPSPTGPLHVGGARSALFNYLFARKNKGSFVLRIEDTDLERSEQKWTQEIIEELKWLGVNWDEGPDIAGKYGPYKQSQRLDIYEKYLKQLLDENKAYYCFCSEEELEASRQEQMARGLAPHYSGKCANLKKELAEKFLKEGKSSVIRFRIPHKKVKFVDLIRDEVEFDAGLLGDIVIAKNISTPLYHFAVVVDDYEMEISHVIRGEEHLSNTPRQILIQEALGFWQPTYAHLPLMLNPDRSKLSKRKGDTALKDYHEQGYLPEALVNFMVLLGWNPGTEKEIFNLSTLEKEFSLEKVQKAGAVFNVQRLDFINGLYIREKSIGRLTKLCIPYLKSAGLLVAGQASEDKLEKIVEVSKTRMKKLSDIVELSDFFFNNELKYDKDLLRWATMQDKDIKDSLMLSERILSKIKNWNLKTIEEELVKECINFNKEKGYPENNRGFVLWPLRAALSGKKASPSPFEIAEILGKEKTLKRIENAIKLVG